MKAVRLRLLACAAEPASPWGSFGLSSLLGLLLIATHSAGAEYTDGYPDCDKCDDCSGCYERQEEFSVPCGWKHTGSDTAVRRCSALAPPFNALTLPRVQDISDWARLKPWSESVPARMTNYVWGERRIPCPIDGSGSTEACAPRDEAAPGGCAGRLRERRPQRRRGGLRGRLRRGGRLQLHRGQRLLLLAPERRARGGEVERQGEQARVRPHRS